MILKEYGCDYRTNQISYIFTGRNGFPAVNHEVAALAATSRMGLFSINRDLSNADISDFYA